jgi:hypothetical protein
LDGSIPAKQSHHGLCVGKTVVRDLASPLGGVKLLSNCEAGWATQTINIYSYDTIGRLIVLPHLSRFNLFHRPVSEKAFGKALARSRRTD